MVTVKSARERETKISYRVKIRHQWAGRMEEGKRRYKKNKAFQRCFGGGKIKVDNPLSFFTQSAGPKELFVYTGQLNKGVPIVF